MLFLNILWVLWGVLRLSTVKTLLTHRVVEFQEV